MRIFAHRATWAAMAAGIVVGTLAGTAITLAVPAALPGTPALADSTFPSQNQVDRAKAAARAKAAQVTAIKTALAAAQTRADTAGLALEQAAEAYDLARIQLDKRTQDDAAATAAAAAARASLAVARQGVGQIAAREYRDGTVTTLGLVLDATGPDAVLERAALLEGLGQEQGSAVERMSARRQVADALDRRAADALAAQQAAASAMEDARRHAEQTDRQAKAVVAATTAEQGRLNAQLAGLRVTSVRLTEQRAAGLAGQARAGVPFPIAGSGSGAAAARWAERQVGLPYQWGAAGPGSYDCSGLTMRAWQSVGVSLLHHAASQYEQIAHVPYSGMRQGDLIFYATNTADPATIHHVTIFAGGGMMVEAPATGLDVRVTPVRWGGAMPYAARP